MTEKNNCASSIILQKPYAHVVTACVSGWHRRPLPDVAIPLNTDRGKRIFREALLTNGLNGYFSLADAYHTQSEPTFCGPGTLSMVLNSLSIDPGYRWKGPWRFFDESTLRTCDKRKPENEPLKDVINVGLSFEEFLFLAECNGASIIPYLASNSTLELFRSAIISACTRYLDDIRLVCSYNRVTLQQTGTGHFSPIAGYHAEQDLVLILDVARFKYPSHWISVELLWKSMCDIDPTTGRTRGFYLLSRWPNDRSIQCDMNSCQNTNPLNQMNFCSIDDSLSGFINSTLSLSIDITLSIESIIQQILQSLTSSIVKLTTKWTFDILQKYRVNAVSNSTCTQKCQCENLFELYPTLLPESIDNSQIENSSNCKTPCARVTRSHIHAFTLPTHCALVSFLQLFEKENNRKLYCVLEQMTIEQYLRINTYDKTFYLYGGLSSMVDDNNNLKIEIERGLTTIFLYALRTETFLSTIDLFDSSQLSTDLKDEIVYAKSCLGL